MFQEGGDQSQGQTANLGSDAVLKRFRFPTLHRQGHRPPRCWPHGFRPAWCGRAASGSTPMAIVHSEVHWHSWHACWHRPAADGRERFGIHVNRRREVGPMKQTPVRLPETTWNRLQVLAARIGRTTTFYIREAFEQHLEGLYTAEQADIYVTRLRAHPLARRAGPLPWSGELKSPKARPGRSGSWDRPARLASATACAAGLSCSRACVSSEGRCGTPGTVHSGAPVPETAVSSASFVTTSCWCS